MQQNFCVGLMKLWTRSAPIDSKTRSGLSLAPSEHDFPVASLPADPPKRHPARAVVRYEGLEHAPKLHVKLARVGPPVERFE